MYGRQRVIQQPDILYQTMAVPASSTPDTPVDCILTKFIRTAMNKVKCPVYSVCVSFPFLIFRRSTTIFQWSPEGKRLITGCQTGEFTLWNGTAFNFETILQVNTTSTRDSRRFSNFVSSISNKVFTSFLLRFFAVFDVNKGFFFHSFVLSLTVTTNSSILDAYLIMECRCI